MGHPDHWSGVGRRVYSCRRCARFCGPPSVARIADGAAQPSLTLSLVPLPIALHARVAHTRDANAELVPIDRFEVTPREPIAAKAAPPAPAPVAAPVDPAVRRARELVRRRTSWACEIAAGAAAGADRALARGPAPDAVSLPSAEALRALVERVADSCCLDGCRLAIDSGFEDDEALFLRLLARKGMGTFMASADERTTHLVVPAEP